MSNYLDMNPGRYKRIGTAIGVGIVGVGIIAGGIYAVTYVGGAVSDKISGMYHEWKGDAVPETFPLVKVQKTPSTLDEVVKEGKWKLSSGLILKVEQGTGNVQQNYKEDLKIYETEEKIEEKTEQERKTELEKGQETEEQKK